MSNRWWLTCAQHHRIPGSDGAAGAEPVASEATEELRHENGPERPTTHAVDDEVDGRVEGDENVAQVRDVSTEQLEGGTLDDGVGAESHLQRPQHLCCHGNQVTDDAKTNDYDNHDCDAAGRFERRGIDHNDRLTDGRRPREGVALEAAEAGLTVGVRMAEGDDDEGVEPDEDDRRQEVVRR